MQCNVNIINHMNAHVNAAVYVCMYIVQTLKNKYHYHTHRTCTANGGAANSPWRLNALRSDLRALGLGLWCWSWAQGQVQVSSWKAAVSNCPATFMLLLRKGGNPKCGPVFHRNSGIGRTVCFWQLASAQGYVVRILHRAYVVDQ